MVILFALTMIAIVGTAGALATAWFVISLKAVRRASEVLPQLNELRRMSDDEFRYTFPPEVAVARCQHYAWLIHQAV